MKVKKIPTKLLMMVLLVACFLYGPAELSRVILWSTRPEGVLLQIDPARALFELSVQIWLPYLLGMVIIWRWLVKPVKWGEKENGH